MNGSVLDLEYHEFLEKVVEYPTEVLVDLAEALEDRLKGLEAAISAVRKRDDREHEARLLMAYAWSARKLATIVAIPLRG